MRENLFCAEEIDSLPFAEMGPVVEVKANKLENDSYIEYTIIIPKSNLIEYKSFKYQLQDVENPNLYRDIFDYEDVPIIAFNHR